MNKSIKNDQKEVIRIKCSIKNEDQVEPFEFDMALGDVYIVSFANDDKKELFAGKKKSWSRNEWMTEDGIDVDPHRNLQRNEVCSKCHYRK